MSFTQRFNSGWSCGWLICDCTRRFNHTRQGSKAVRQSQKIEKSSEHNQRCSKWTQFAQNFKYGLNLNCNRTADGDITSRNCSCIVVESHRVNGAKMCAPMTESLVCSHNKAVQRWLVCQFLYKCLFCFTISFLLLSIFLSVVCSWSPELDPVQCGINFFYFLTFWRVRGF